MGAQPFSLHDRYRIKIRLQIWHLFYLIAFYASGLALSGYTIIFTTVWIGICALTFCQTTQWDRFRLLLLLSGIAIFVSCLFPSVGTRGPSHAAVCRSRNFRMLSLAMLDYEATEMELPLAGGVDRKGRPVPSWRVMLLPFIERQDLFDQYHFDEAWDGPNNRKLASLMPSVYRCPSSDSTHMTYYKLVTGPGTAFPGNEKMDIVAIRDGPSNCIMMLEDVEPVHWMQPTDLSVDQAVAMVSGRGVDSRRHSQDLWFTTRDLGVNATAFDGSTYSLSLKNDPEQLQQVFRIDDGNADLSVLRLNPTVVYKYEAVFATILYGCCLFLPFWFLFVQAPEWVPIAFVPEEASS